MAACFKDSTKVSNFHGKKRKEYRIQWISASGSDCGSALGIEVLSLSTMFTGVQSECGCSDTGNYVSGKCIPYLFFRSTFINMETLIASTVSSSYSQWVVSFDFHAKKTKQTKYDFACHTLECLWCAEKERRANVVRQYWNADMLGVVSALATAFEKPKAEMNGENNQRCLFANNCHYESHVGVANRFMKIEISWNVLNNPFQSVTRRTQCVTVSTVTTNGGPIKFGVIFQMTFRR